MGGGGSGGSGTGGAGSYFDTSSGAMNSAMGQMNTGPNWMAIAGSGLQSFGKGMGGAGGSAPSPGSTTGQTDPLYIAQQQAAPPIPQNNIVDALMRILSGG